MLISCPKCGFSQPEDRYCASCGVDMRSYEPPKPPLLQRLTRHPLFPVIVLMLSGLTFYAYTQRAEEQALRERVEYLSGESEPATPPPIQAKTPDQPKEVARNRQPQKKNLAAKPPAQTTNGSATNDNASLASQDAPSEEGFRFSRGGSQARTNGNASSSSQSAESAASSEDAATTSEAGLPTLNVTYAEVSNGFLDTLLANARRQNQLEYIDGYGTGHVLRLSQLLRDGRRTGEVRVLASTTKSFDENNLVSQWFSGARDPASNQDIGITTLLALTMIDGDNVYGEIDIQVALPDVQDPSRIHREPFITDLQLSSDQSFFMTGILPPRIPAENDEALYSNGVLKILFSESFQQNETKFVIFVMQEPVAQTNTAKESP